MEAAAIGLDSEPMLTPVLSVELRVSDAVLFAPKILVMNDIEPLMRQISSLAEAAALARKGGDEAAAEEHFRTAFDLAVTAAGRAANGGSHAGHLVAVRQAVLLALEFGEVTQARRLMDETVAADQFVRLREEWEQVLDISAWPDTWLIAAVRRDPPDAPALDVLADRYWKQLFARCQMLTLNREKAGDLAQQAWCRLLRARHTLKPGGNFPGLINTIAMNLWRDSNRAAKRSGPLAENRLASLDASFSTEEGETSALGDTLPDLNALREEEQKLLALDLDQALERLSPLLREVLVSRLLAGESCAEIGRRFERTEQTISAWVRQGLREMREYMEGLERIGAKEKKI